MHMTVRGGKSTHRWAFDQGSGGYQSMPTNEDPGRTNAMPPDQDPQPQPEQDPQRAAELAQGTMDLLQKLRDSLEGEQLDWLDSLLSDLLPPGTYDALSGVTGPVGRPTVPTMDTPPSFPGVPRTGARDGYRTTQRPPGGQDAYAYRTMQPPAADQRPRGSGPGGQVMAHDAAAIDDVLRRGRARQAAKTTASLERRFPGALSRLKRAF
jgi:hypothetical protein